MFIMQENHPMVQRISNAIFNDSKLYSFIVKEKSTDIEVHKSRADVYHRVFMPG